MFLNFWASLWIHISWKCKFNNSFNNPYQISQRTRLIDWFNVCGAVQDYLVGQNTTRFLEGENTIELLFTMQLDITRYSLHRMTWVEVWARCQTLSGKSRNMHVFPYRTASSHSASIPPTGRPPVRNVSLIHDKVTCSIEFQWSDGIIVIMFITFSFVSSNSVRLYRLKTTFAFLCLCANTLEPLSFLRFSILHNHDGDVVKQ